jgi:hypothetical protein
MFWITPAHRQMSSRFSWEPEACGRFDQSRLSAEEILASIIRDTMRVLSLTVDGREFFWR